MNETIKKIDNIIDRMECTPCKGYIESLQEIKKDIIKILDTK